MPENLFTKACLFTPACICNSSRTCCSWDSGGWNKKHPYRITTYRDFFSFILSFGIPSCTNCSDLLETQRLDLFCRTVFINGIPKSVKSKMHVIQYCQLGVFFGNLWAAFDNFSFTVFTSAVHNLLLCFMLVCWNQSQNMSACTYKLYMWHVKHMCCYMPIIQLGIFVLLLFMYSIFFIYVFTLAGFGGKPGPVCFFYAYLLGTHVNVLCFHVSKCRWLEAISTLQVSQITDN